MGLLRHTATVGGYTMASRILGFVRDVMIAALMAAGPVADAFFVAQRLPNMFRSLVAEGAFSAAFVPMFSGAVEREGKEEALRFAEEALAVMLAAMLAVLVIAEIAMPALVALLAPGFTGDAERFRLTTEYSRITFPYLTCMAVVALFGGVLNAFYRFSAAASAPILMNGIMILALLGFHDTLETAGHALAWSTAIAGLAQLLWLVWSAKRNGVTIRFFRRPRLTPGVKKLLRLMLPGVVGAGVQQLSLFVSTIIASFEAGAVSILYYADRLNQLPLAVIGVAVGVALLPLLSRQLKVGDMEAAAASQNRAIEFTLVLTLPAAAALVAIPEPIVSVLFERGQFTTEITRATSWVLAAFALGLPAYVLVKALLPGFYAREDIATPVRIACASLGANVALALALVYPFGAIGIALATAASSWINAVLLAWVLRRRGHFAPDTRLTRRAPRMVLAAILMAVALVAGSALLDRALHGGLILVECAALAGLIAGGVSLYGGLAILLGGARLDELRAALRRAPRRVDPQPPARP